MHATKDTQRLLGATNASSVILPSTAVVLVRTIHYLLLAVRSTYGLRLLAAVLFWYSRRFAEYRAAN